MSSNSGSHFFAFEELANADLIPDAVLTTTLTDPDWPDSIDRESGIFTYYGDNKKPGRDLHDTPRFGNEILRRLFDRANGNPKDREKIPPIFVFASAGEKWRDMTFIGLAVPGISEMQTSEDLVAIWKSDRNRRFQNYRARFSILDVSSVSRAWLRDLERGKPLAESAPGAWKEWIRSGRLQKLRATKSIEHRRKSEQLPANGEDSAIVHTIHRWFAGQRAYDFEKCAGTLAQLMLPNIEALEYTRFVRDGGRDAIGRLRIGDGPSSILVDFALEAKCYSPTKSVGVRALSRLISRLRHRQFGILVTTSYLDTQAYKEIKEDKHPIIVISARDIVELLRVHGHPDQKAVEAWLNSNFPELVKSAA